MFSLPVISGLTAVLLIKKKIQPQKMVGAVILLDPLTGGFKYYRTILYTGTAAGTAILDDTPGPFSDLNPEIPRSAFHGFQIRVSDKLDV